MIRAGRHHLVRTLADLAAQQGVGIDHYTRLKPYDAEGFPKPINSQGSRTRLYDGEQVDAYLLGKPVPPLPETDDDGDLLDRRECAALIGVAPDSWKTYKNDPSLAEARIEAGGVEHWPRHAVRAFQAARPGRDAPKPGRPKSTGDQVPRDQVPALVAELLDADPTISAATVTERLGVHRNTGQDALTRLRADRIADHIEAHPTLTPTEAAAQLGYPAGQIRRATARAETVLRARHVRPYLDGVAAALHRAGWTTAEAAPDVQFPGDDRVVAALVLDADQAPVPALVWDERYGWRTATSRRHPITKGGVRPSEGEGVRYLTGGITPPPGGVVAALAP
ncbi:DUF6292 family protein [Streptomyces sp. ME02-6979.5a]|uniref:DUF6292 family protein n=1 Tax=Streptomyces sp. ME02-6979.5a TaxID=462925 RepID=UPI00299FA19D|nr:DUF6292 family protein [Streptomyces sp. ME02-6979.5a]MDX3343754.1 DUF6292 family protein [Streptomyces sp. ME02-6979.5a]